MRNRFMVIAAVLSALALWSNSAFAQWKTACDKQRCQLFHEILNAEMQVQSRVYFHDLGRPNGNEKANAPGHRVIGIATVPLGIHIPTGIEMRIDDKPVRAELVDCTTEQGCRAAFDVDPATLQQLKSGKQLSLAVQDRQNERTVTFSFGLADFGKAYDDFLK